MQPMNENYNGQMAGYPMRDGMPMQHEEQGRNSMEHEHHEMSPKEIMRKVKDHDFKDEVEIGMKYLDYATAFDQVGQECLAKKFAEMGYEEYTHAYVQREMLMDEGRSPSVEDETLFKQLESRIHTLFRG